jgi:2-C-methyl-D-erythritol 4-phosphate cytidylyltransferase
VRPYSWRTGESAGIVQKIHGAGKYAFEARPEAHGQQVDLYQSRRGGCDAIPLVLNARIAYAHPGGTTMKNVCVILVAGGVGTRMQTAIPKQFLHLNKKEVARHSFDLFAALPEIKEIVVVCAEAYRHIFDTKKENVKVSFAQPGERRQDSVYNGLQAMTTECPFVCIHDAARQFITQEIVQRVLDAAREHGAAVAGMPLKFTIKECSASKLVQKTPDRSCLWEIQTPQAIETNLLKQGFAHAHKHNLTVTDDVSLIELLGLPVKVVPGCYRNIKITTPDDLAFSELLLKDEKHDSRL